jgi:DtxR family Mn-dependent transcriptional regulator
MSPGRYGAAILIFGGSAGFFLVAVLLARRVLGKVRQRRETRLRVTLEDALKHVYGCEERGARATIESLAGSLGMPMGRATEVARRLHERGLVVAADGLGLSAAGRRAAQQLVRAHRLWERYLADELQVPIAELHRRADRHEHGMAPDEVERLAAALGHPQSDPHGDPIPLVDALPVSVSGWPLTMVGRGIASEIVHLEDEPEDVFARLVAQGLEVGQQVTVRESAPGRLAVQVAGRSIQLSPIDAANIFVAAIPRPPGSAARTLADLRTGERATVRGVRVSGFTRRRLFDLGFTPGVVVECAFPSAFGEPRAYRVRGSLIALRPEQARRIEVEPAAAPEAP